MSQKNNKLSSFIQFITTILILIIFAVSCIAALDVLNIIDVPEQYSLTRFLTASKEITLKEYIDVNNENVEDATVKIPQNDDNENKNNKDTVAPIPDKLKEVYQQNNVVENDVKNENKKYYYIQLDEYGKIIYNKMYENIDNLKTGTYNVRFDTEFNDLLQEDIGSGILESAFQSALNALIYDNPELFFIDIRKMYLYTETTTIIIKKTYKVYIGPEEGKSYLADGFNSEQEVNTALNLVNEKLEKIKQNLSGSDYLKVKTIHNYLIDNIEYDQTISRQNIYNIYGALVEKLTVCEGYAKSFKYILDNIGIECMLVCGVGTNSDGATENHAWNYVSLNGNWYAIDLTWDDPIIIGNGKLTDTYRYRYFLKGSNEFYRDHKEDGQIIDGVKFYYPVLSQKNY